MSAPVSQETIEQVNKLMMSGFEIAPDKLVPSACLVTDFGLDSLDFVDMLVYIEETMGIKVEGERLTAVRTLSDVYRLADDALRGPQAQASQML